MIYDSSYWKDSLMEAATWLEVCRSNEASERTLAQVEKEIFVGFYAIRKLMDTVKISDSTKSLKVCLTLHPNKKRADFLNYHQLEELYDFDVLQAEERKLRFVCNQIVHSFIFEISANNDGLVDGIYVASDREKDRGVYFLDLHQVIRIFRTVGNDYPAYVEITRNPNTGEVLTVSQ